MNAIISLCHFCECHGPKILFCTQPFRPQEPEEPVLWGTEDQDSLVSSNYNVRLKSTTSSLGADGHSLSSGSTKEVCEGCKSVRTGFVSKDEEAHVTYVSTQQPYNQEVFSRIRQACIRSLSCEVCPGREGPIFFGDQNCGHVLSYTFYISDTQARGLHRLYSIIVVMMDKIYLLNSWPFLVPQLKVVIDSLQAKALKVYDVEESKCPQKLSRAVGTRFDINRPTRSLTELTNYKNVFPMLHVAFLWILKACGNRLTETLLEGPPTEDSIIDMEKQEETEEGFIKIYMRKIGESEGGESRTNRPRDEAAIEEDETQAGPVIKDLRHLKRMLGSSNFYVLAHHAIVGNQVIVSGPHKSLIKSFLNALKCLLPKGCCRMISYSLTYEESWRCNFLGLSQASEIPEHVKSSEMFVLVELIKADSDQINHLDSLSGPESDFSLTEDESSLQDIQFRLSSPVKLPDKGPQILNKMMLALENNNLTAEVVTTCFTCLKEEWMNKVKVLFKFTKAGRNRSDEDTKKLYQVVGAREEDKQLLHFWTKGLSAQYRTHILASSASSLHR